MSRERERGKEREREREREREKGGGAREKEPSYPATTNWVATFFLNNVLSWRKIPHKGNSNRAHACMSVRSSVLEGGAASA